MIVFKSISTFRQSLQNLLNVKRNVYQGITEEILKEFNGKKIEEIRQNRDMILIQDESVIIKLRLPDKKQRLSKKDGYRLIYYVSKISELVIFLQVYPKNGPLQKLNITPNELKSLLITLIEESNSQSLQDYDFSPSSQPS